MHQGENPAAQVGGRRIEVELGGGTGEGLAYQLVGCGRVGQQPAGVPPQSRDQLSQALVLARR
jgi:hypothetical protein